MVIFRIIEKLHLTKIFTNNYLSYIIVSIIVIALTITTSYLFSKLLANINNRKFKINNINQ